MMTSGMYSSVTDNWATPQDLFDRLNAEFHLTLDVCADESNHKCANYFTKEQDGLLCKWGGESGVILHTAEKLESGSRDAEIL